MVCGKDTQLGISPIMEHVQRCTYVWVESFNSSIHLRDVRALSRHPKKTQVLTLHTEYFLTVKNEPLKNRSKVNKMLNKSPARPRPTPQLVLIRLMRGIGDHQRLVWACSKKSTLRGHPNTTPRRNPAAPPLAIFKKVKIFKLCAGICPPTLPPWAIF